MGLYGQPSEPGTDWGAWEGWGTSLCWWGKAYGDQDNLADIVFTTGNVVYNGATLPGLGLNIVRYNAGACTFVPANGAKMVVSPNIRPFRQMEGYWLDWNSDDPSSASWNWGNDAAQRTMLGKARDRGANLFELFSNSPMWWMCYNQNPSGSAGGSSDNLQSWNYQQHARYLAVIARYAHDHWGVDFHSVEAFNEPSLNWTATGTQEGCHFGVSTQQTVITYLRSELNARGLTGTMVTASDETAYDQATSTWNALSPAARASVGKINTHGYQYGGGRRDLLYAAAHNAGKVLWNSEYGEGDATGLSLASNLNLDFTWLHPTAWVYWQVAGRRRLGPDPGQRGRGHHRRGQPQVLRAGPVHPAHPAGYADHRQRRRELGGRLRSGRAQARHRDDELRHRPVDQLRPVEVRHGHRLRRHRTGRTLGHADQRQRRSVRVPRGHVPARQGVLVMVRAQHGPDL